MSRVKLINLTPISLSSSTIIRKRHCSTWHCSSISQCTKWKRLCSYWLLLYQILTIIHQHLSQWYGHTRSPTSTVVLLTTQEDLMHLLTKTVSKLNFFFYIAQGKEPALNTALDFTTTVAPCKYSPTYGNISLMFRVRFPCNCCRWNTSNMSFKFGLLTFFTTSRPV